AEIDLGIAANDLANDRAIAQGDASQLDAGQPIPGEARDGDLPTQLPAHRLLKPLQDKPPKQGATSRIQPQGQHEQGQGRNPRPYQPLSKPPHAGTTPATVSSRLPSSNVLLERTAGGATVQKEPTVSMSAFVAVTASVASSASGTIW